MAMQKCLRCGGTGQDPFSPNARCVNCKGWGSIEIKEEKREKCYRCKGSGWAIPNGIGNTKLVKCWICGGEGYL